MTVVLNGLRQYADLCQSISVEEPIISIQLTVQALIGESRDGFLVADVYGTPRTPNSGLNLHELFFLQLSFIEVTSLNQSVGVSTFQVSATKGLDFLLGI
ncbi:hypothetical protein TNCV_1066911 [Trichonephila clavipes]|uniref:Uncharacterized protein n=1 Tax=Trichonephila clavipes TaxID=2585209 RepID=A0A8X6RDA1_TRICX|nr:hypothetical protein TNCV_1066911 [Trichonephila clavipes]